ncbi:REP-associated tyrosine transposase [Klebsiella aerogenes]|nr:transposase [Klebsiella aerogenes]
MVAYRRYYIKGGTWFFTVNLKDRRSRLLTERIELFRYSISVVKQRRPFIINAWVVLPEHLHCIWTLPNNDDVFSSRWRDIKGCFSRTLKRQHIWQPRFWEHAIRDEEDYRRHVDYIHINPLKHGWVTQVIDWPFSTFHREVQRGLYPANWAGESFELSCGERR